MYQQYYAQTQ
jgi:hypothetical protein